jgi:aldehyde dehydrogenase (NAD+)
MSDPIISHRINEHYLAQRKTIESGMTLDVDFRIEQLKRLRRAVSNNEALICEALAKDLGRPEFEAYIAEIVIVLDEIDFHIKHLRKWVKPKKVRGNILLWPSGNEILQQPYGVSLIIGPWNYPFQLLIMPLIGAISAGCTVVLKPSEMAPTVAQIISKLLGELFESNYIVVVEGGVDVSSGLLKLPFDKIFFTGSTNVGKIVMSEAAKNLTPVTLELGGKSPAVIDQHCDIYTAAKRIWWGKCMNAGQTCVATDYVLLHESIQEEFVRQSQLVLDEFFIDGVKVGINYSKIINQHHFDRLKLLLKDTKATIKGDIDEKNQSIGPTLVTGIDWNHPLMQDEIFGPIMPVFTYKNRDDLLHKLSYRPNPLALYVFSKDKQFVDFILNRVSFGGGGVNDTVGHLANLHLPFGGIGKSGMGNYHGYHSFSCFSHSKSIMRKSFWPDISIRYPPYGNKIKLMRRLFK